MRRETEFRRSEPIPTGRRLRLTSHVSRLTVFLLAACGVTPLTNRIDVGNEAFVIGVGEGPDSLTDLYAARAGGGSFVRLSYNRAQEAGPRLSPSGTLLVYLRSSPVETTEPEPAIVILNLLNGAERSARIPRTGGAARAAAWLEGDSVVVVRSDSGFWRLGAPAGSEPHRIARAGEPGADSALAVTLGHAPSFGRVEPCPDGGSCIRAASGDVTSLGTDVSGVLRWGADSVGYFRGNLFEVRPLGGGRVRRPSWTGLPARLRELSYHAGQVTTETGVSGRR